MLIEKHDSDVFVSNEICNERLTDNQLNSTQNNSKSTESDINKIISNESKTLRFPTEENDASEKLSVIVNCTLSQNKESDTPGDRVKFQGLSESNGSNIVYSKELNRGLPPIPDGGWGWVVVASAFIISACVDGVAFSFGLLQEEFTSYFQSSNSKTSLIGGLLITIPTLCGPLMSALVNSYGCRKMTIVAGIMSTLGFLLAAISNSVEMLCLTYGVISGFAMGILYVTAVVPVTFWFEKRRNFAVSLASCGIGVGTLIYSPFTYYLLSIYDWRNTVIILAGTLLNMCVCGAVLRDPDWLIIKQKIMRNEAKLRKSSSCSYVSSRSSGGESAFLTQEELKDLIKSGESPEYILKTITTAIKEAKELEATTQMNAKSNKRIHSHVDLPTFMQQNEKVPVEVIEKLLDNKRLNNIIIRNFPHLLIGRKSKTNYHVRSLSTEKLNESISMEGQVKILPPFKEEILEEEATPLIKNVEKKHIQVAKEKTISSNQKNNDKSGTDHNTEDSFWLSQSIKQQKIKDESFRSDIRFRGPNLYFSNYKSHAISMPNMYRNSICSLNSEPYKEVKWYHRLWRITCKSFDIRMFNELYFLMFNLSSVILAAWFTVPYFFLTSYMSSLNVEGGAIMISIIGIASSIGIIALGWAGDLPWVNVPKAYMICILVCGLSVACYPLFITNFWALAVISATFGVTFASSYSYIPAMLLVCVPVDHFTVAYGLILFSEGVGHLVGPPLAGYIYDVSGKWEITFYAGGLWIVVSGLCVGVIAYTKNLRLFGHGPLLKDLEDNNDTADVPLHV